MKINKKETNEEREKREKEEKNRLETLRKKQYLVTAWTEAWAGHFSCQLEIIGVFDAPYEACHFVAGAVEADREIGLKRHADRYDLGPGSSSRPDFWDANSGNRIVYNRYFRIGDGSGFQSCYKYYDVLEIGRETKIGESMFAGNWDAPHLMKSCFERLAKETHFVNSGYYMTYAKAQIKRAEVAAEYRRLDALCGNSKKTVKMNHYER